MDQIFLNRDSSTGFGGTPPSCTPQSSQNLMVGAGFDSAAAYGNWYIGMGGTSWSTDTASGCPGSVSFATGGSMTYCYKSVVGGSTYYLGFMGRGGVGCMGQYFDGSNCDGNGLGPEFFNIGPTDSASWAPSYVPAINAYSSARSLLITCTANNAAGAMDQIFLNRTSSTGF
jgi:hypothetical protein